MSRFYDFEDQLFSYLDNFRTQIQARPLNLGGVSGSNGGSGGPPGGFIGYLPQSRVAFDVTESNDPTIPESGASLLTNLNRIRYRLSVLESGGGVSNFLALTDTPSSYNTFSGYYLRVKPDETGIEFVVPPSGGGASSFLDLTDTPSSYLSYSGALLAVNNYENGIVFRNLQDMLSPIDNAYNFFIDGTLSVANGLQFVIVESSITIKEIIAYVDNTGTSGITTVSIRKNGNSIGSVSIAYDDSDKRSSVILSVLASKGDILDLCITQVATDASTLSVTVLYESGSGIASSGNGGHIIALSGTAYPQRETLSFTGSVTISDDPINNTTIVDVMLSPSSYIWLPDAPPEFPSNFDDEFDDGILDSKWEIFDPGNVINASEREDGLLLYTNSPYYRIAGIYQPFAYQPMTFYWKMGVSSRNVDWSKQGLFIIEDIENLDTTNLMLFTLATGGFRYAYQIEHFGDYQESSYIYTYFNETFNGAGMYGTYFRIIFYGDLSYRFQSSYDGISWQSLYENSMPFVPTGIGFFSMSNGNGDATAIFKFFRASNTTDQSDYLRGRRVGLITL